MFALWLFCECLASLAIMCMLVYKLLCLLSCADFNLFLLDSLTMIFLISFNVLFVLTGCSVMKHMFAVDSFFLYIKTNKGNNFEGNESKWVEFYLGRKKNGELNIKFNDILSIINFSFHPIWSKKVCEHQPETGTVNFILVPLFNKSGKE